MYLDEYVWSRNPRGMHNAAAVMIPDVEQFILMRLGWAKLTVISDLYLRILPRLAQANITPIIRVFEHNQGYRAASPGQLSLYQAFAGAGVRWFEFYNEPNLSAEWAEGQFPGYSNPEQGIFPLMENWLNWAEFIIGMGGYPAFPALSETTNAGEATIPWLDGMLGYLRTRHLERFRRIADSGLWVAVHAATLNHFYQEVPNQPGTLRQPENYNGQEGGWVFDYPYDPISQSNDPGRTVFGGTPKSPLGDPNGLTAMGRAFMARFADWFGGGTIPVVSTEGGILPIPPSEGSIQLDTRFPPYDRRAHAEATLAMFNYIAASAPPWYFGLCAWKEDEYIQDNLPAVRRLKETSPIYKDVPRLAALGGKKVEPVRVVPGPGPIHGNTDIHFLLITPTFSLDWFFAHCSGYWQRFRPMILTNIEFGANLPNTVSLGITILSLPGQGEAIADGIRKRWPNVWIDLISVETGDVLASVMQARLQNDARYG
jgi:hypothetical protein